MIKSNVFFLYFCIFFIIFKFIAIYFTNFNLYGDEAQYWLWSKDLSFGYFSKPPLLPWLIFLITFVFGNSFFVIKSIPIFFYCITSFLVFFLSKKLFKNTSVAFLCAITFFLMPSVSFSSFVISTDIVLILFWTASLIMVQQIKTNPSIINFLLLGVFVGLGFLAKYAAIYFILCLFFLILIDKDFKFLIKRSKLKIVLFFIVVMSLVAPNLFWNHQHEWLTMGHTVNNASLNKIRLNPVGFFSFLISQIIMIGPILFLGFLFFTKKNKIDSNEKFLLAFSLPPLAIVLVESFLVRAHANWAAVSHITLFIFFFIFVYKNKKNIIYFNNFFNLAIGFLLFVLISTSYPLSIFDRISGTKDFVNFLDQKNIKKINNIVIDDRLLFASLNYAYYKKNFKFYSPHGPGNKIVHHFQLKNPLPENFSENFILIGSLGSINYLKKNFEKKKIGSKSFPFSSYELELYEIKIK